MGYKDPFFSIIIPTYNRPRQILSCLQALSCLDYPRNLLEVIVVDDGSEKLSENIVGPFSDHLDLTFYSQLHTGPAGARNAGAERAKGTILVFTDDDCTPAPDWLKALAMRFQKTPDCIIGGPTVTTLTHNLYSTASQLLIDYLHSHYNNDPNNACFLTTSNLAVPKDRFNALGGFDQNFLRAGGEDREFCHRWLHNGFRMIYAPEVVVHHTHVLTFLAFWRQHFNYGRGAFQFRRISAHRGQKQSRLEPLSFYVHLLCYPFSLLNVRHKTIFFALFAMSQAANAAGYFWGRVEHTPGKRIRL
jgi:GT2 family glycosyltransferase